MTLTPDTLCDVCRVRVAECELEDEPENVPLCIGGGCADAYLERLVLVDEYPELARELAPLRELVRELE